MNEFRVPDSKKISMVKSKINNEFNNQRTQTCCVLCGKSIIDNSKAFHKSHTVPYFCLENIKALYNKNYGVLKADYPGLRTFFSDKEFIGTNKAGVFYSICSDCDQEKFNIYENEEALLNKDPRDMVNSMALKIYLNELFNTRLRNFKNTIDYSRLTDDQMISSYFESIAGVESPTVDCDIRDFETDLKIAKTAYENGYRNYRIIFYKILDYTVPIAAQTSIPISHNIDYSKLQEVAQIGHKRIEDLLICIFPLKEKSVIIAFYKIGDNLIKKYSKQFFKLSEEEKLKEIFYLLLRHKTSNYFYSPLLKEILQDVNIRGICSIEDTVIQTEVFRLDLSMFEERQWKINLPSILSERYSVQNLLKSQNSASCK